MPHKSIFPTASVKLNFFWGGGGGGGGACDISKNLLASIVFLYKFKILPVENNLQFKSGRNDRMVPLHSSCGGNQISFLLK